MSAAGRPGRETFARSDQAGATSFVDAAPHRASLPAAYQQYRRVAAAAERYAPQERARQEDIQALLQPLFMTSFLIDDFFARNDGFGARRIVIASASSKTALGLAFLLKQRGACEVVGLTSPGNLAFCERLGYHDRVLTYDRLAELPASAPAAFVDMAGAAKVSHEVHHHFGANLVYSCIVGATHWDERGARHGLPGAKPVFFFAPEHLRRRAQELSPQEREQSFSQAWNAFVGSLASWLEIRHARGEAAVRAAYLEVLEGRSPPAHGHVLSF